MLWPEPGPCPRFPVKEQLTSKQCLLGLTCQNSCPCSVLCALCTLLPDAPEEVAELAARVRVAAAYMARVNAALKGKQGMEEVEAVIALVGATAAAGSSCLPAARLPVLLALRPPTHPPTSCPCVCPPACTGLSMAGPPLDTLDACCCWQMIRSRAV